MENGTKRKETKGSISSQTTSSVVTQRTTEVKINKRAILFIISKMASHKSNDSNVAEESTSLLGNNSSPFSSTKVKLISNNRRIVWIRRCWAMHFILALFVLSIGMFHNYNPAKKYLKVNPSLVVTDQSCATAYLNVMASSSKDKDATVCCTATNEIKQTTDSVTCMSIFNTNLRSFVQNLRNFIALQSDICAPKSQKLPFVSRLTKFPDAWLLPLFPLLFRLLYGFIVIISNFIPTNVASMQPNTNHIKPLIFIIRRLLFYFILMNFRGWVLYIFLNKVEDQYVAASVNNCWYMVEGWFPQNSEQSVCVGRQFDFSDHIVLYYAQILPIALFETLHIIIENPYWYIREGTVESNNQIYDSTIVRRLVNRLFQLIVLVVYLGMHIYLQVITTYGAHKTSIYFHTPVEITTGFIISMTVALPLCFIQCRSIHHPSILSLRSFLFEHL